MFTCCDALDLSGVFQAVEVMQLVFTCCDAFGLSGGAKGVAEEQGQRQQTGVCLQEQAVPTDDGSWAGLPGHGATAGAEWGNCGTAGYGCNMHV